MLKEITIVHQSNGEIYHPLEGWYYADDESGRIWSEKRHKWLKGDKWENRYLRVCLVCKEGKHNFFVHRLIWEAFNGEIPEGLFVNHLDEHHDTMFDNRLSNLNLLSMGDNNRFGTRKERAAATKSKSVNQCDLEGNILKTWSSATEAQEKGNFSQGNISECCRNCYKREGNNIYKGFLWTYNSP